MFDVHGMTCVIYNYFLLIIIRIELGLFVFLAAFIIDDRIGAILMGGFSMVFFIGSAFDIILYKRRLPMELAKYWLKKWGLPTDE